MCKRAYKGSQLCKREAEGVKEVRDIVGNGVRVKVRVK